MLAKQSLTSTSWPQATREVRSPATPRSGKNALRERRSVSTAARVRAFSSRVSPIAAVCEEAAPLSAPTRRVLCPTGA